MPPQQGDGLLNIVGGAGDFGTHGGGYKEIKRARKAAFAGPLDLLTRFARRG